MSRGRLRGSLLGLAVGDALGAAVEFKPRGSFPPVVGYRAGGPHRLAPGEWTDDTSMALALADSITQVGWDLDDQARRYVEWWKDGKYSVNGKCFDIGSQTSQALTQIKRHCIARESSSRAESASGNGSIMRLAPVVIRYHAYFPDQVEVLLDLADESSIPTHASPICRSACRYMALLMAGFIAGVARNEVLDPDWPMLKRVGPLHPAVQQIAAGSFRKKSIAGIRGGGFVIDSLEAALWALHGAADFREAVLQAINLGEDTDTTGAVCGQLAGALWGESGIPPEWLSGLAKREMLESALAGLMDQVTMEPVTTSLPAEPPPPNWTYWVQRQSILAGCFPGDLTPNKQREKLRQLIKCGVRVFVNLTELTETHRGKPLADYEQDVRSLALESGHQVKCLRFPIRDLGTPTLNEMDSLITALGQAKSQGITYLHCLGGIGRTGTVAACWLISSGSATLADVFGCLDDLRTMDQERGQRRSPETPGQRDFIEQWAHHIGRRT